MIIKVKKTKIETLYYDTNDVIAEAKEWEWFDCIKHCSTRADWIGWFESCGSEDLPEKYIDKDYDYFIEAE